MENVKKIDVIIFSFELQDHGIKVIKYFMDNSAESSGIRL